jgi:hypothetical protein
MNRDQLIDVLKDALAHPLIETAGHFFDEECREKLAQVIVEHLIERGAVWIPPKDTGRDY